MTLFVISAAHQFCEANLDRSISLVIRSALFKNFFNVSEFYRVDPTDFVCQFTN